MITYRRSRPEDLPGLCAFWRAHWGDEFMVVHDVTYHPRDLNAWIALEQDEWVGLATYKLLDVECEIVSLDSLREGRGIGTRLIEQVVAEARQAACTRVFLITTNDNLEALGFYQKRGFELVKVDRSAVDHSRKIKPGIPRMGRQASRCAMRSSWNWPCRGTARHRMTLDLKASAVPRSALRDLQRL